MTSDSVIAPGANLVEGTLLGGRYRLAERVAMGGMGVVHRGWDQRLARPVALKFLHPNLAAEVEVERRFRAEARHAARVKHPNVVVLLDQDEHHGVPFIVMELVAGTTLREMLCERGRLTPAAALRVLEPVCAGLAAIHRTGLVHRDIKPDNLLIDEAGTVRVTDFGIARALDASLHTPAGVLLGSVRYMAPELVLGRPATPASDQYALGVVLFEALTERAPLHADDPAVAALRHAREAVPAPSSVGPPVTDVLDDVVTTATAMDPADRYPTLDVLLTAAREAVRCAPSAGAASPPAVATRVRPAPYDPTVHRSAPGNPPPPPQPAGSREHPPPTGPQPRERRPPTNDPPPTRQLPVARRPSRATPRTQARRISVLAITGLLLACFGGTGGFLLGGACGSIALRRIMRRDLRGAWVAQLAIGVSALRLLAELPA